MRPVRAFLAIPLPDEVTQAAGRLGRELAATFPQVRWVRPETIHLTLRFFGDIPEESLEKIGEVMLSVARLHSPFQVTAAGVGAFPSPSRPRVIWLGIKGGERLMDLQSALDRGLEAAGLGRDDRSFSPHLTLGRARGGVKEGTAVLGRYRDVVCGPLPVERIILFESRLHPAGAIHLPRKTVPLGQ